MATSILVTTLPVGAATRTSQRRDRHLGRRCDSRRSSRTPLSENGVAIGRELGFGSKREADFSQRRRRVVLKAQEKDEGGPQVDDSKPFYAALEFWIQVSVVVLTFGFVDAGYSGDWSRIGALSRETEAQLRTAAYAVVPFSAALVWVIGKRKKTLI